MVNVKTIGIIGAGVSGLVAAKTCLEYGYSVIVFEKDSEAGGVWAASRRYPGIATQNTKDTYHFSDFPMPAHYPQWPDGEQVQAYLTAYAKKFGVFPLIRFCHEITGIRFQHDKWILRGRNGSADFTAQTDFIIVSNGTFSDPVMPPLPGMENFTAAGGQIIHSTQFHSTELSRGKRVVVLGYGKSAHDLIVAASETAASAHLVFREPKWKIPRYINGVNIKYLLLNRLGEAFVKPGDQHNKMDRFVHRTGLARRMLSFMEKYISKKQRLRELDLLPSSSIKDQAFGEISLETPGFFDKVRQGKIITRRGEIASFNAKELTLSGGKKIPCDLVIFSTGFKQTIPFLPAQYRDTLLDEQGNYILYRHILPAGIPKLAFVGYNTSIQCPLSSEMGALWVCEYLKGRIAAPTETQIIKEGTEFIRWRSRFRPNGSSKSLSTMPGTMHHIDLLLNDMRAPLPPWSLLADWLLIAAPTRYKKLRKKIVRRNVGYLQAGMAAWQKKEEARVSQQGIAMTGKRKVKSN